MNEYSQFRASNNMVPLPKPVPGRQKHPVVCQLSQEAHDGLKALASRLGYNRSDGGNVTLLLEALGQGILEVTVK